MADRPWELEMRELPPTTLRENRYQLPVVSDDPQSAIRG